MYVLFQWIEWYFVLCLEFSVFVFVLMLFVCVDCTYCTVLHGMMLYYIAHIVCCAAFCVMVYMVCMNLYCVHGIACYLLDCKIPCFVCNYSWGTHGIPWVLAWYCLGWCCKVQNWMVLCQMELHVLHIMHVFHWIALVVLVWVEVFNRTSVSGINQTTGLLLLPYTSIPELQW